MGRRFAVQPRTRLLLRKAMVGFLREGAILLAVFGFIDGMTGHQELACLGVSMPGWFFALALSAVIMFWLSVSLELKIPVTSQTEQNDGH